MIKIWAVTLNSFREAMRDKILYTLLFFAVLMILASVAVAQMTIGEYEKVLRDLGLTAISIFGLLIAIFVGIGLVNKEIERKTIYTIVSKPVHRWQFLVGKFLGLSATLLVQVLSMGIAFVIMLILAEAQLSSSLLAAVWLSYTELLVVTATALLFSSFSSPVLASMFTIGFTLIGKLSAGLVEFTERGETTSEGFRSFARLLYHAVPDLQTFNVRTAASYGVDVPWEFVLYGTGYALAWSAALLLLASIIFQFREFK
jgi:ABC-type transport system involved in multi-copper enzyme maturation permease subunit